MALQIVGILKKEWKTAKNEAVHFTNAVLVTKTKLQQFAVTLAYLSKSGKKTTSIVR